MHYQPKLFQVCPHCYCYYVVVVVVAGGGNGDGGVAAKEFAEDDVMFQ